VTESQPPSPPAPTTGHINVPDYSVPVMDAQIAEQLGQSPQIDDDFYGFTKSALRQEAVPQVPPSEANGATLVRQRYEKEKQDGG
jgi:hypothetical protein